MMYVKRSTERPTESVFVKCSFRCCYYYSS